MGFLTRCKRLFSFAFLLQNRNTFFSFFLKSFLILSEKQQPQCDICKSSSYAITHLHHSAESDKQKQALSHRLACYGLCCGMSQQLVCNRVWTCSFPSYCVSSLFAFDRTRRLLQKLKKSTSQMNSKKCSHSIAKPVAYSFELRHSS